MAVKAKYIDIDKIKGLFDNIDEDRQTFAIELIDELMFMKKTMADCKAIIQENGVIELFSQGSNQFNRENPAVKTYNTTIKNYNIVMKQLLDLLPKVEAKETKVVNPLIEFMD